MQSYLVIGFGGALGSIARFWFSGFVARHLGDSFPFGTLLVNISGSFIIGCFAGMTNVEGRFLVSATVRQFFMIGICGGYTTFSSFSLQTLDLMRAGEWLRASLNAGASVFLCLLAVWLGHGLGVLIGQMKG